jgi:glycosyltransferase involved in cell wall biosynthesis
MGNNNKATVIFSTYNSVEWLEKTIIGFSNQTFRNFEIIIADDGSGPATKDKIDELRKSTGMDLVHVWQEDHGFKKSRILNKAIMASSNDYLIFTDGDCIPRHDFVEQHVKYAEMGYFLSGGYFKLPMETSLKITKEDIRNGNAFNANWLLDNGLEWTYKLLKLTSKGWLERALNRHTTAKAVWNGHNSSGWKRDILSVNGFDERMEYGGQDREMGERLANLGIKSKQIRYSAICVHLDHSRDYAVNESVEKNLAIRKITRKYKLIWTPYGIKKTTTTGIYRKIQKAHPQLF